jgi:MFS family permease
MAFSITHMKKRFGNCHFDLKNGKKNIFLVGGSSFFNDVGSEMITPLLPFYISALGGTGLAIGLISGLREGLSSLFKLLGGWLSDRKGKRVPFIFLGYLISVVVRFLLVMVSSWQYLIGLVSFERIGKLRDAPRDALIAQSTKKRGNGFAFHQMMDTTGGIFGTLIVIWLFWKLQLSMKTIILVAAGISILSLFPLFFVKEPKFRKMGKSMFKGVSQLNKKLKYFIFVSSIFALANFGLYFFFLLRAKQITGNVVLPLVLYALFSLVYAVFVIPFGNLSDKIGKKKVLFIGYVLFFLVTLSFIFLQNFIYLVIMFIFYGLVYALTQSNQRAFVADFAAEDIEGTALGFFSFVTGIVNIFGGIVAGILWDINYQTMFVYLSGVAFVSLVLLFFVKER